MLIRSSKVVSWYFNLLWGVWGLETIKVKFNFRSFSHRKLLKNYTVISITTYIFFVTPKLVLPLKNGSKALNLFISFRYRTVLTVFEMVLGWASNIRPRFGINYSVWWALSRDGLQSVSPTARARFCAIFHFILRHFKSALITKKESSEEYKKNEEI